MGTKGQGNFATGVALVTCFNRPCLLPSDDKPGLPDFMVSSRSRGMPVAGASRPLLASAEVQIGELPARLSNLRAFVCPPRPGSPTAAADRSSWRCAPAACASSASKASRSSHLPLRKPRPDPCGLPVPSCSRRFPCTVPAGGPTPSGGECTDSCRARFVSIHY